MLIISKPQGLRQSKTQDHDEETEKEREERELEKSIEKYANLAMTEVMIDEDDLLDDIAEMEKQAVDAKMEDGRIEAISQLSPERHDIQTRETKTRGKTSIIALQKEAVGEIMGNNKKEQNNIHSSQQATIQGRRRGARSSDLKGALASKKLASRGLLSTKAKVLKSVRETTHDSSKVPRHVVYPSASSSRKTVSKLGSVVS
ncbi:hypothetical protein F2Q70_00026381 [Brassica cretica]|nr:hypothetical protein F2Q70_00026381 [Brassica cretica]